VELSATTTVPSRPRSAVWGRGRHCRAAKDLRHTPSRRVPWILLYLAWKAFSSRTSAATSAASSSRRIRRAVHLPPDHFDPVDVAFHGPGAVGQGSGRCGRRGSRVEPGGEGAQVRQVAKISDSGRIRPAVIVIFGDFARWLACVTASPPALLGGRNDQSCRLPEIWRAGTEPPRSSLPYLSHRSPICGGKAGTWQA
jgi:hypothetical protein